MSDHTHTINHGHDYASHTHTIGSPSYVYAPINISGEMERSLAEYRRQINHSIFEENVLLRRLTNQAQEKPMSTLDKIKQERREKREREELEAKFGEWEAVLDDHSEVGSFTVYINEKRYRYATIVADEKWYLTGATTCGMATEEFIAWLIDKKVDPHEDFEWMQAVG